MEELRQGWIVLHIIAAIYLFVLLGIICNNYFLPTVECICEDLNLSKDVAAATFMATATSMPEFFTNSISTLLTGSDIGLGTIIGSLMFNTLGVASLAAMVLDKPIQLDWWPIARDCFIYSLNTIALIALTWGGSITFLQTCIMMLLLVLYYVITFNNNRFMPAIRVFVEDYLNCCFSTRYGTISLTFFSLLYSYLFTVISLFRFYTTSREQRQSSVACQKGSFNWQRFLCYKSTREHRFNLFPHLFVTLSKL